MIKRVCIETQFRLLYFNIDLLKFAVLGLISPEVKLYDLSLSTNQHIWTRHGHSIVLIFKFVRPDIRIFFFIFSFYCFTKVIQ